MSNHLHVCLAPPTVPSANDWLGAKIEHRLHFSRRGNVYSDEAVIYGNVHTDTFGTVIALSTLLQ